MPTTLIALQILLILLPGFSAACIVQLLALRAAQSDLDKVIEALLFSFLIYSAYLFFNHGSLPFTILIPSSGSNGPTIVWQIRRLAWLVGLTLGFAVFIAAYINWDGARVFRLLKLTERTSRRSIWNDIFQDEAEIPQILQVELDDGRSVLGVLRYYSDSADDCSIYLTQAEWVGTDGTTAPINGPGILLTKNSGIRSIAFLDPPDQVQ